MNKTAGLFTLLMMFQLPGCASNPNLNYLYTQDQRQAIARSVDQCLDLMENHRANDHSTLPANIRLLSWNVKKGKSKNWEEDFSRLSKLSNLIFTQEAFLTDTTMDGTDSASFVSLSPGYVRGQAVTGVATYSSVKPLVECHLASTEPVLRSHKATSITLFDVPSASEQLLVANVHAINFSLGLGEFTRQMQKIETIVARHDGPVIFGGDFNTWRAKRVERVTNMARRLQLTPVEFEQDDRSIFLGHVVDHIYLRGLSVKSSRVERTLSSDHNPLIVELQL